jgi:cyanate permease
VGQVALAMLVWNVREEGGMGWPGGLVAFALFGALAVALWRYGRRSPSPAPA